MAPRRRRHRFVEARLDGLVDEPRPGRPRTVSDAAVEKLITETLESTPKHDTHWSSRSMGAHLGMSQSTVSRVWRAFGLAPHKSETWKLSKDPQFTDKVRDVVGLYLDPPERALVLCVDEKTQINLVERWFAELTTKKLQRSAHRSVADLNADIRAWIQAWNDDPKPYIWTKTADDILDNIAHYCSRWRTSDSEH